MYLAACRLTRVYLPSSIFSKEHDSLLITAWEISPPETTSPPKNGLRYFKEAENEAFIVTWSREQWPAGGSRHRPQKFSPFSPDCAAVPYSSFPLVEKLGNYNLYLTWCLKQGEGAVIGVCCWVDLRQGKGSYIVGTIKSPGTETWEHCGTGSRWLKITELLRIIKLTRGSS